MPTLLDLLYQYAQEQRMGAALSAAGPDFRAACRLAEQGVKVQMFDTSVTASSYILSAAFWYSHLVFAAPTYNAGVFITMDELLRDIAAHGLKDRRMALLENGSWAPASGREMGRSSRA